MVSNLRATAMSATIFGLPAPTRRSKNAFKTGLCRLATMAPMNNALRTAVRPPPMKLLPRHWPDWRVNGATPTKAAILLAVEPAQFGQFGDQRAGNDRADARHRGQQVFLVPPGWRAAHGVVDVGIDAG